MFQEVRVWSGIPSASVRPMKSMPTNAEVSARIGISEEEVALYRQSSSRRVDGFWVINFSYEMPALLRKHLSGSFTVIMAPVIRS